MSKTNAETKTELIIGTHKPTLCLNMIVKNESRIIKRLFDSVLPIIDTYCICDTGSTDNTIELIGEYFKEKGISGKVIQEPFKNFCHNRNVALQGCVGMSDYVLLLDADMILEVGNFDKALLNVADSFLILQGSESFHYQNTRIVRNNGKYSYSGVTHEYINTPESNKSFSLSKNILFINDIGDGGAKSDKLERDIRLLTEGLKAEPNNVRYYFYLGNSYRDSGKYEEAIQMYKKRIELGGWKEEVWYSWYRIGSCYKDMNKFPEAIEAWLEGYNLYPERLEGLYELIKHYRNTSKHKLSMAFYELAKEALEKNHRRDGYLFLHNDVYTFLIYYEYTIIAYYLGIKDISNEVVKIFNACSGNEVHSMLSNMKFYKQILNKQIMRNLDSSFETLIFGTNTKFVSSSSCLIKKPNSQNYWMNVRYVNYHIQPDGSYINCDKHIITINKFVELDKDLNVLTETQMDLVQDGRRYMGIEDVKIYWDKYENKLMHIGTGFHLSNQIGISAGFYNIEQHKLESMEQKQLFANTSCEKNWVYIDYNNATHVIYDWHPMRICKSENNILSVVETKQTPKIFSKARGSTCGFNYTFKREGQDVREIWFVNHIVSYESPRHYYHIVSVFDSNMNLLRYTAPFKFEGECIEYCLSIVVEDERVLINYSTWDRTTRIGVYDKKYFDSLLVYK